MFEKRSQWFSHELQIHRREWCCNEIGHQVFLDKTLFIEHLRYSHSELNSRTELAKVVSLFERPSTTSMTPCPFCMDEDTKNLSLIRYEKHIARHMEILALFALPRDHGPDERGASADSGLLAQVSKSSEQESLQMPEGSASPKWSHDDDSELLPATGVLTYSIVHDVLWDDYLTDLLKDTHVPKDWLVHYCLSTPKRLHHSTADELMKREHWWIDQQIGAHINIFQYISALHPEISKANQSLPIHHQMDESQVNQFVALRVEALEQQLSTMDIVSADVKERLRSLVSAIRAALDSGPKLDTEFSSWEFIQPKVPVAASALTLLSRALAVAKHIQIVARQDSKHLHDVDVAVKSFGLNTDVLVDVLKRITSNINEVDFGRDVAKQIEEIVWSQAERVESLEQEFDFLDLETREDLVYLKAATSLTHAFRSILEILGIDSSLQNGSSAKTLKETTTSWLREHALDSLESHQAALTNRSSGTSAWFLSSQEYDSWTRGKKSQLWLLGNPACGKTVLCSTVIENLKIRFPSDGVAYFYYQRMNGTASHPSDILTALAAQYIAQLPQSPETLQAFRAQMNAWKIRPSKRELLTVLAKVLGSFETSYMVIDGIDYSANCRQLLGWLGELEALKHNLSILISCRYGAYLTIGGGSNQKLEVFIGERDVARDVEVVLETQLQSDELLKFAEALRFKIKDVLLSQTGGMYV